MEKTFSQEVRGSILKAQNGYSKGSLEPIHSFHHMLPNTKANRKRCPLFIQSPMNCVGLSLRDHTHKAHKYRITEAEAQVYEDWLNMMSIPF